MPARFRTLLYALHRIVSLSPVPSAALPTPEGSRDDRRTSTCSRKPATLSQSYSSPELPVSSESLVSTCSLRAVPDGKQPSPAATTTPSSLHDPSIAGGSRTAAISRLTVRSDSIYDIRDRRKYERSHSEVTLLKPVEICGELKDGGREASSPRRSLSLRKVARGKVIWSRLSVSVRI